MMIQKLPPVDSAAPPLAARPVKTIRAQPEPLPDIATTIRNAVENTGRPVQAPAEIQTARPPLAPPATDQIEPSIKNIAQAQNPQKGTINLLA
jgi:hypothetical protein